MRDGLIELVDCASREYAEYSAEMFAAGNYGMESMEEYIAGYLLANGVIVPPCKVGDTVYYISGKPLNLSVRANTIYEADVVRIITTQLGTTIVIQIHNEYGCTEIPDIDDFGKTVFLTKEEAEQALRKEDEKCEK